MSMTQKILSSHVKLNSSKIYSPGEFIEAEIDLVMVHEQLGGRINKEYEKLGIDWVENPENIVYILDHWVPSPDIRAARMHQEGNTFARKYGFLKENIMGENKGICHTVIPERGFVKPGILAVGSDSHTTTYGAFNAFSTGIGATDVCDVFATGHLWFRIPEIHKINLSGELKTGVFAKDLILTMLKNYKTDGALYKALEFGGKSLKHLNIASRITIANMAVEMGAKNAIFEYDNILNNWIEQNAFYQLRNKEKCKPVYADKDTDYEKNIELCMDDIVPMIAKPHSPDNSIPVSELDEININQGFIGSCTNGSLEDLRIAAKILKNNIVNSDTRCIIIPASTEIYKKAIKEGLFEIFLDAGCVIGPPTCGPCIGGHMGVLGDDEICISTTNRNFKGRMGSHSSKIYLASPATVAASVIEGKIVSPMKYFGGN